MSTPFGRLRYLLTSPWLCAGALVVCLQVFDWYPVEWLDLAGFDLLARGTASAPGDAVAIVVVDDASLRAFGAWPWSRRIHADLVDRLHAVGARAVVFDVLFADASRMDPDADARFADAMHRSGRVVLPLAPAPTGEARKLQDEGSDAAGVTTLEPLAMLAHAAHGLGHVDIEVDRDAIARRIYLEAGAGQLHWPALALAGRLVEDPSAERNLPGRRAATRLGASSSSWTRDYEVLLPHGLGTPEQYSFAAVLRDPAYAARLRGKLVFVGMTATGLGNPLTTTLSALRAPMPAVEFHARAYDALRSGNVITPLATGLAAALSAALLALVWAGTPRVARARRTFAALMVCCPLVLSGLLVRLGHVWFPPAASVIGLLLGNVLWRASLLKELAQQLFRAQQRAQATLHAIAEGVLTVGMANEILYANPMARQLVSREDLDGTLVLDLFAQDPTDQERVRVALQQCRAEKQTVRMAGELMLESRDRMFRLVRLTLTPLIDRRGDIEGTVLAFSDVTEASMASAQLDYAASHDSLTGLPNRTLCMARLRSALAQTGQDGPWVAVAFLDIDRFKLINDSLGHRFGDEVLKRVAVRLRQEERSGNAIARWGGDEFLITLRDCRTEEDIARSLQRVVRLVSEPIVLDGVELQCLCSVGVAIAPKDSCDVDQLLALADIAMSRSKTQTSARIAFYSADMSALIEGRLQFETDLRQALVQGEFELHYQALFDLRTGQACAMEALVRWRRASGQLVLPADFIGIAEETGLILPLGAWVINEAADQLARWQRAGHPCLPISVNVSAWQCLDHGLVTVLREALSRSGIAPGLLTLELTESTAMRNVEHVIGLMNEITALGVGFAVDDFGTGYSSLAYLKRLPLKQIKIDQSFVHDIVQDANDAAIVATIIALAHGLSLPVVAEGVETEEQRAFLAARGCDFAQGFLFARPVPAAVLASQLGWANSAAASQV